MGCRGDAGRGGGGAGGTARDSGLTSLEARASGAVLWIYFACALVGFDVDGSAGTRGVPATLRRWCHLVSDGFVDTLGMPYTHLSRERGDQGETEGRPEGRPEGRSRGDQRGDRGEIRGEIR